MLVKASHHQRHLIKCSLTDRFVLRVPVSVVFFYRQKIPSELIIESLQKVLADFPVFAGTILFQENELFIDCNNQGVRLKIVESSRNLMKDFSKTNYTDPIDPKNGPVLTIQLNYYADGMAIGYTWNHTVGDMATFMEFLKALSACAKRQSYTLPLILKDRNEQIKLKEESSNYRLKRIELIDFFHLFKEAITPKKIAYIYFTPEEINLLRDTLSNDLGYKISRNDALCAHLFDTLSQIRSGRKNATIVINFRSRLNMHPNILGNFVDTASVQLEKSQSLTTIAGMIHRAVKNYQFDYTDLSEFIRKVGGPKKINRIIPKVLLPQEKNLLITSWANFNVYSIDFGIEAPFLFLPVGKSPLPWVSNIVEGLNNQGLLVTLMLPSSATKRLLDPANLQYLHQFRSKQETLLPEEQLLFN